MGIPEVEQSAELPVVRSDTVPPPNIHPEPDPAEGVPTEPDSLVRQPSEADSLEPEPPGPEAPNVPWAESVLASMTLEEKAGQLLMPFVLGDFAPVGSRSYERIAEMIQRDEVGGVIMSVGTPTEVAAKINYLQSLSKYPLLVGADLETGAGFRMRGAVYLPNNIDLGGATNFPSLMAVGATGNERYAYDMGRITAVEARAVGIHLPFGPVLDVNNNPSNPIISIRSFGEDPATVSRMGISFVRGLQDHGTVATGKHFPGHGDTETDSHVDLPVIRVDRDRLNRVELRPFQDAIDAGMGGIMSAHVSIPTLTGSLTMPSTLSPAVLSDLLKRQMGFDGLIVTDAMDMFAIDRRFGRQESVVRAIEAGADIILMPPSTESAREGVVDAVQTGRISEARLDSSVVKILRLKEEMDLHSNRETDIADIHRKVGIPAHVEVAQEIADQSITLLRNDRDLLPLRGTRNADVLSVTYRAQNNLLAGRYFNARVRGTYRRLRSEYLHRNSQVTEYERLMRRAHQSDLVIVSTYVSAARANGDPTLPEELSEFIQALARYRVPHVVVSFGNPYLLSEFPDAQSYLLAWSGSDVSQRAAAKSLFGEIDIRGRTPTRLPPLFEIGDGIQLPRRGGRAGG